MSSRLLNPNCMLLALIVLAMPLAGCARTIADSSAPTTLSPEVAGSPPVDTQTKQVSAAGISALHVDVKVGRVEVTAGGSKDFDVKADKKYEGTPNDKGKKWLADWSVRIEKQGNRLEIEERRPKELNSRDTGLENVQLELTVRAPSGMALNAGIGVGDVVARGSYSDITADSGVGAVRVEKLDGAPKQVAVTTGTGNIDVIAPAMPTGGIKAEAGVGRIEVGLPGDARARLTAETGVGSFRSDFPIREPARGIGQVGFHLTADLNGGGAPINASIGTGDLRLKRL